MDKRFLILDTDGDVLVEVQRGAFTVGITEVVSALEVLGTLAGEWF